MRHPQITALQCRWLAGVVLLATVGVGCREQLGGSGGRGGASGSGGMGGTGGSVGIGPGDSAGAGWGGEGGMAIDELPCTGASDPRMVVAPQRRVRLTLMEVINSVRSLVDATAAAALLTNPTFGNIGDETLRKFPPLNSANEGTTITDNLRAVLDGMAEQVGQYVFDHFTAVTGCPSPAIDDCATAYLDAFAERAYRRPLGAGERDDLTALYRNLRGSMVNDTAVTSTVEEATQKSVSTILSAPQFLYRTELGDPTVAPSVSPPGIPLTQYELASALSFFLGDAPPDQPLLDAAKAGTLSRDLDAHATRLLGTQAVRDWLTTIMFTYFKLNLISNVVNVIDTTKYPQFNGQLLADLHEEGRLFLDHTLWTLDLPALLTSRTTFLNSNLATTTYKVPVPPGATATQFVQTTLPAYQRSGLLTNAAFITSRARSDDGSVVARGLVVFDTMLCMSTPPRPPAQNEAVGIAKENLATQTPQEQVAYRASVPACGGCHALFDPFGLAMQSYDNLGTYRTVDDMGRPVDTRATLPATVGGGTIQSAIELAGRLAASPAFESCMAKSVLQYAMTDVSAWVDMPNPPGTSPFVAGCAVRDVTRRFDADATRTFSDLVRAVVTSSTFSFRTPAP